MTQTIKAFNAQTPVQATIGKAVNAAVSSAFIGKVSMPLQMVIGKAVAEMNRKGLVTNNVLTGHNMDALLAENAHSLLMERTINSIISYLTGYGKIETKRTSKKGKWTTHWRLVLDTSMFRLMEKEDKGFNGPTLKRLRNAAVQSLFSDNLGVNTEVTGIDKAYLEGLSQQDILFVLNNKELQDHVMDTYSKSKRMANKTIKYERTRTTKANAEAHVACVTRLNGKTFPVTETLEPRGRTAKQQLALLGMNFYGKTWETQSFRLGEETIAWDARQSGYQILGGLLGSKALCEITGVYGNNEGGDIYTEAFAQVLTVVFGGAKTVTRLTAKKPAQMLAYMAGMASILLEDEKDISIWDSLSTEDMDFDETCEALEAALWENEILVPVMELRQAVRDGQVANYAVPTWSFPGTSEYFFTRSDTSFLARGISKKAKVASIMMVRGDDNKNHQMTIHISMIREFAKSSAILAAVIHALDALLKKLVSLDVWAAGGKILIKHDEYVVDKEHEAVMIASYHKWLAHIAANRNEYLAKPLEECGYVINLDAMVRKNEERYGKFNQFMVHTARHGLAYEWSV